MKEGGKREEGGGRREGWVHTTVRKKLHDAIVRREPTDVPQFNAPRRLHDPPSLLLHLGITLLVLTRGSLAEASGALSLFLLVEAIALFLLVEAVEVISIAASKALEWVFVVLSGGGEVFFIVGPEER
jgi:hypothetical protein